MSYRTDLRRQPSWFGPVLFLVLLGLCAAYLQGGLVKATGFSGAIREMTHFGLEPAAALDRSGFRTSRK